ncbi:hypothetical protein FisN_19Lu163 [Fistulifera solaris]|uniref:Uncharacterized protein n=1 Tax=Fistulifera solaris TaxID=1519565 RepID=A0A1Z5J6R4_FISSO|nr:hypothetical protein FisN_19Lu163 [Fistulifera solaris]|eukprot:GAX09683.1 hypothetical protein FisN_19Lu163 [Fistulifera solaris]
MFAHLLIIVVFFFGRWATWFGTVAAAAAAAADDDDDDQRRLLNVQECRWKGFDPMRLACSTCDWLPQSTKKKDCQQCCQSYFSSSFTAATNQRRTTPYQAAVLVQSSSSSTLFFPNALDRLLADKEEWEKIRNEKGGDQRLQVITTGTLPQHHSEQTPDYLRSLRPNAEILLLDETLPSSGVLSYEKLQQQAVEIISLYGLTKDDIQDLLRTVLP